MEKCSFCGFAELIDDYVYCPNCGMQISYTEEKELDSEHVKLWGGESRIATLFFVNFVNTAENTEKTSVHKNVIYLAEAMQEVENIIKKFDGTARKILPDNRIIATFGIPRTHKDDPERAIKCIMEINAYCNSKINKKEFGDWRITIGVNTGWIFFGYVIQELSYLTIIGDTVNIAARITQMCPLGHIYLSNTTYELLSHLVDAEFVGERTIKGRAKPVKILELKSFQKVKESVVTSRFPLLGREREFNSLLNFANSVKENKKIKLCAIVGQMGIGKTRLKEEFRDYLLKDGSYQVFESYCAVEIHTPYYPFKLLFREFLHLNEFDSRETIAQKIDDFAKMNNLTSQDAQGLKHLFVLDLQRVWGDVMQKIQEEIFIAVKNFLKVACEKGPLILIFEEFNRIDNLSKMLISFLATELTDSPLLMLMVNFVGDPTSKINVPLDIINLGPLSSEDVSKLIRYILNDVDERLIEFVCRTSGGNPLFTIEIIRSIQRIQLINKKEDGQWYLEKEKRLPFLEDLYGVVMSGIDALSPGHRLIIDYASVIGYSFSRNILNSLLSGITDLQMRLDYLLKEDYIVQFRGGDDPVYIFRHNLLRDAVYTTLPLRKRKEIHQRVAELLETVYSNCLSEYYENLGQQFISCEKYDKAAHYFKLSGDKAKSLYSVEPAINYYNTVAKIEQEHPGTVDFELLNESRLGLSDLYEIKGDIQRMKAIAEIGLEGTFKQSTGKWNLLFTERLARSYYLLNEYNSAENLCIEGIEKCNDQMPEILTLLYTLLGMVYLAKNEPEKSLLNYNLAWSTARANNLKEGEFACLLNLSKMHRNLGNYELCLEYLNYAIDELLNENEVLHIAEVKYLIGEVYYEFWNLDKAYEYFKEAFALTERVSFETPIKSAMYLALLESIHNKETEAEYYLSFVDKKISFFLRDRLLAEVNLFKSMVLLNFKQFERVKEFINNALKIAKKLNYREIEFFAYIILAGLDEEKAEGYLKEAQSIAESLKFPPLIGKALFNLALFYSEHKDTERADYFGRKALFVYDDIKGKLKPENREYFIRRPEYNKLLEI